MKLDELIDILTESMNLNGNMNVVGIVDGTIYNDIDINCPDEDSPMYIELYESKEERDEDFLPDNALYIKGYLTVDYDGIPAVTPNKKDSYFQKTSIIDSIKSYAESNGFVREHNKGLGGHQVYIRNCNMRAYFCKRECSLATAQRNFDKLLYGGDIAVETEYTGYSEWTITGMDLNEFTLGGHDLKQELDSHMGEYIHLIITCN